MVFAPTSRLGCALLAAALLTACVKPKPPVAPPPDPGRDSASVHARDAEQRAVRLQLLLLERDAQVNQLQDQLDAARREVVRAMAKLQTLASRAEAASGMAEAEVALQSLHVPPGQTPPGIEEARRLIEQASQEFNKGNYAGALYLANQAKSATGAGRTVLATSDSTPLRQGEVVFALPLALQTTGRANVREGPGSGFRVLFTLDGGVPITGYSYDEQWVRVIDDAGRSGWVHFGLIARRAETGR
jgi:TolA-binding protein